MKKILFRQSYVLIPEHKTHPCIQDHLCLLYSHTSHTLHPSPTPVTSLSISALPFFSCVHTIHRALIHYFIYSFTNTEFSHSFIPILSALLTLQFSIYTVLIPSSFHTNTRQLSGVIKTQLNKNLFTE